MKFKEWFALVEVFDSPLSIDWKKKTDSDWIGEFFVPDPNFPQQQKRYIIRMVKDINMFDRSQEGTPWEVQFKLAVSDNKTTDAITGTGDAMQVFSTVMSGIHQWLNEVQPNGFMISAREPNRQSLYRRMLKTLPPIWEVEDLGTTFFVTNKNAQQPAFTGFGDDDFADYFDDDY